MKNFLTRINDKDFGSSFFENALDDFFRPNFFGGIGFGMRTDVKETENGYEISVDLPGFDKNDITLELDKGYLNISAKREVKEEDENSFIKKERSCSCSRRYYVGEGIDETDVKAKYENGVLSLSVSKKEKTSTSKKIQID